MSERNPSTHEKVFVWPGYGYCGGIATIVTIDATDRSDVRVEMFELPGVQFNWVTLLREQEELARKYAGGGKVARMNE